MIGVAQTIYVQFPKWLNKLYFIFLWRTLLLLVLFQIVAISFLGFNCLHCLLFIGCKYCFCKHTALPEYTNHCKHVGNWLFTDAFDCFYYLNTKGELTLYLKNYRGILKKNLVLMRCFHGFNIILKMDLPVSFAIMCFRYTKSKYSNHFELKKLSTGSCVNCWTEVQRQLN